MRKMLPVVFGGLLTIEALAQIPGTALVRHASTLNGAVNGSIQQMTAESVTLNGNALVSGDLLVPGTPTIRFNGNPSYGGTLDGSGGTTPSSYTITVNGGAKLRHVIRRSDAAALPAIAAPLPPTGTRSVSLNYSTQSPGDFATLRDLALASNVGTISVPPGTYGNFIANPDSGFVLGVAGASTPAVYNFQTLTLNSNSRFVVVGPVVVTLAGGFSPNTDMGEAAHPEWLHLRIANGGLSLTGDIIVYAQLEAPEGFLTLNGNSRYTGAVSADRLIVNGNAVLELIAPPVANPPFQDNDHDGMDDVWEAAHGLNPLVDDANLDNDKDGVPNSVEFKLGLNPNNPDSDGDGLYDGDEIALGLDPTTPNPDNQPPSTPAGLAAGAVTGDSVTLTWQPATDNLKVSGYLVYRDGQPIETPVPIRGTTFTDTNLPDGEEFAYQVRSFDFAGNLSPLGPAVSVTTVAADTDHDGLPDEWESKYFGDEPAAPGDDPDGDGLTNLQEFQGGTDPKNFYNGINPVTEKLNGGREGSNGEVALMIRKPDGTPWANAPYNFDSSPTQRKLSVSPGGPFEVYQLRVRAGSDGVVRCYVEPLAH